MKLGLPLHQQDPLKQLNLPPQRIFAGPTLPLTMTPAMLAALVSLSGQWEVQRLALDHFRD